MCCNVSPKWNPFQSHVSTEIQSRQQFLSLQSLRCLESQHSIPLARGCPLATFCLLIIAVAHAHGQGGKQARRRVADGGGVCGVVSSRLRFS